MKVELAKSKLKITDFHHIHFNVCVSFENLTEIKHSPEPDPDNKKVFAISLNKVSKGSVKPERFVQFCW